MVVGGTTLLPVFILVVFPVMIDLFGRSAAARRAEEAEELHAGAPAE